MSVLDKEGEHGDTCPFRYPVATKKCIVGVMWEVVRFLVEFFCQDTLNPTV